MPTTSPAKQFVSLELAQALLQKAVPPPEWKLTPERIQPTLERSVAHRFANAPPPDDPRAIQNFLDSLQAADLALACACSGGNSAAWDFFVARYRPELYRAARAIAGESAARELADSLYADLYGLREVAGQRKSLFDYFLGRSKLTTWLHAILAQRHVDAIRRARRTESLDDDDSADRPERAGSAQPSADPERERYLVMLQAVLQSVLATLEPRDRLRLAYYYVDGLTLAQIGKLTGEHEATVSRKLERTRREVRKQVDAALRREKKLNDAQLQRCYDYAREEWPFDLTRALSARE
jgi:RNA polymerase sigma-70 factor (ECF subfamily)